MKKILEKFPKDILIDFMLREGLLFRYRGQGRLEGMLLFCQWDHEEGVLQKVRDAEAAELDAISKLKNPDKQNRLMAFIKKSASTHKRWDRNQVRYEKSQKLRGF